MLVNIAAPKRPCVRVSKSPVKLTKKHQRDIIFEAFMRKIFPEEY